MQIQQSASVNSKHSLRRIRHLDLAGSLYLIIYRKDVGIVQIEKSAVRASLLQHKKKHPTFLRLKRNTYVHTSSYRLMNSSVIFSCLLCLFIYVPPKLLGRLVGRWSSLD
jgi:hypothetical protein